MVLNKQNGLLLSFSMGMESTHRYSRPIHTSVPVKQIQTLPQRDVGTARGRRPRNTRIVRKILNYLNFLNYSRLQWPVNRRARSNEGDWGFFYWIGIHWAYYQKLTPKVCHTPIAPIIGTLAAEWQEEEGCHSINLKMLLRMAVSILRRIDKKRLCALRRAFFFTLN